MFLYCKLTVCFNIIYAYYLWQKKKKNVPSKICLLHRHSHSSQPDITVFVFSVCVITYWYSIQAIHGKNTKTKVSRLVQNMQNSVQASYGRTASGLSSIIKVILYQTHHSQKYNQSVMISELCHFLLPWRSKRVTLHTFHHPLNTFIDTLTS